MDGRPPPQPPPHSHGSNPKSGGLPPGNYDIFIVPPHSAGSGFLYLPSLQPQRNSFLAGVICTLVVIGVWAIVAPIVRHWATTVMASGGMGMVCLIFCVGVLGWAFGKTQLENSNPGSGGSSAGAGHDHQQRPAPNPGSNPFPGAHGPPPKPSWQHANTGPASAGWEKAREETRKKEEDRKKKEELEKKAKEAAEKDRLDKARAREREIREREAREKLAQEKARKEAKDKEARSRNYQKPSAQSYAGTDDGYSFRPYDSPKHHNKSASHSSYYTESSYGQSHSTAQTTPPPSHRGPYTNNDPDKIRIKAVFAFTDLFPKPVSQLICGEGSVTDGLILKMTSEGMFVDDDVRGVPQREWDVKAWTMKLVETGNLNGKHVVRACIRDAENRKYIFIIAESEAWKVALGLQRVRRGSQVRSLGVSGLSTNETRAILTTLGWT